MDANPRLQTRPVRTRMPYSCNINRGPAAIVEIGRLLKRTSRAATSRQRIEHERHEEEIMVTADIHHSAVSDPVHPAAGSAPTKVSSTRLHVLPRPARVPLETSVSVTVVDGSEAFGLGAGTRASGAVSSVRLSLNYVICQ
jgi:hypothetical protein